MALVENNCWNVLVQTHKVFELTKTNKGKKVDLWFCDQSEVSYVNNYNNKQFKCKITLSKMIVYVVRTHNTNFKTLRWMGLFLPFSHPSRYISASIDVSKWHRFILCISNAFVDYHKNTFTTVPFLNSSLSKSTI